MKKLLLLQVVLLLCSIGWAAPITLEQARQQAMTFITKNAKMAKGGMLRSAQLPTTLSAASANDQQPYYVFNIDNNRGFVMVSGDDRAPAILGYATSGTFDAEHIPDNMKAWLQEYERQIAHLDRVHAYVPDNNGHEPITPLLHTTWNQGTPYNNLCPIDPYYNERSVTGCLATAMAQVINYHKYPSRTRTTIPSYYWNGIQLDAIAPTDIDWANMLDSYDETATAEQQQAVAQLMLMCGISVEMDYGAYGSGAYFAYITPALVKYFGFDSNLRMQLRSLYRAKAWDEMVYDELAAQRPVIYGGQSTGGGHAFVIDGYDKDGYFHVNWGWGGQCDNYFLLSILDPESNTGIGASSSTDGYSYGQLAYIGVQPPVEGADRVSALSLSYFSANDQDQIQHYERLSNGRFRIPYYIEVVNLAGESNRYSMGAALFNTEGQMVESVLLSGTTATYEPNNYVYKSGACAIGNGVPDGNYTLMAVSRMNNNQAWQLMPGSENEAKQVSIHNDTLTLRDWFVDLDANMTCATATPTVGEPTEIKLKVTNNGAFYNQEVFLMVNGQQMGGRILEVDPGETTELSISYRPTHSGTNQLQMSIGNQLLNETINVLGTEETAVFSTFDLENLRPNSSIPSQKANITWHLHNNSRYTYNGKVMLELKKWNEETDTIEDKGQIVRDVTIGGDADTDLQVSFDGLEDHQEYLIMAWFLKGDSYYRNNNDYMWFSINLPVDGKEDMTYMIQNPDFEWGSSYWNVYRSSSNSHVRVGGTSENYSFEAWNDSNFDVYQVLNELPAGIYQIQVQGFYRYLRGNNAWNAYQNGVNVPAYVYMDKSANPLKNVFAEPAAPGFYSGDYYQCPDGSQWFPNDMATAATAFKEGMYQQSAYGLVMSPDESVYIGVKGATNQGNDSWAIWDNFKLYYLGFAPEYIRPALEKAIATADGLCGRMMGHTEYLRLAEMMEQAINVSKTNDGEQMFQVLNELYNATTSATESIQTFGVVEEKLVDLKWFMDTYQVAEENVQQQAADLYNDIITKGRYQHEYEENQIPELLEQMEQMIKKLRIPKGLAYASADNPVECTSLINDPSFERNGENYFSGWYGSGYYGMGNDETQQSALAIECFQNVLHLYQVLQDVPNGYYRLQVSAFYRYGTTYSDYTRFQNKERCDNVFIYLSDNESNRINQPLMLMSEGAMQGRQTNGAERLVAENTYVPDDMVSAVGYFKKGQYRNYCMLNTTTNQLVLGIDKQNVITDDWMIMDDFRLFYYGTIEPTEEQLAVAMPNASHKVVKEEYYDLSGRRMLAKPRNGISIVRQTTSDGMVKVIKK